MNKKSILVVEDAEDARALLSDLLQSEGYHVECAANGRDALEYLTQSTHIPGLILLDIMMPGMDGHEFRKEQEKDARLAPIPVAVMTAAGDAQVKALQLGAKGYLRKPFANPEVILTTVSSFFDS